MHVYMQTIEWTNEWMNEWMDGWMDGWTNERTNERTNKWVNESMNWWIGNVWVNKTNLFLSQELFDPCRWNRLVEQFRKENFQLHNLNDQSVLSVTLQAGLSALKTPYPFNTTSFQRHYSYCMYLCMYISQSKSFKILDGLIQ